MKLQNRIATKRYPSACLLVLAALAMNIVASAEVTQQQLDGALAKVGSKVIAWRRATAKFAQRSSWPTTSRSSVSR
jgi:hypothetical protein